MSDSRTGKRNTRKTSRKTAGKSSAGRPARRDLDRRSPDRTARGGGDPGDELDRTADFVRPRGGDGAESGTWKRRFAELREKIHRKGRERLTIMVIPHTEKQILNFHLSVYALTGMGLFVVLVLVASVISLVGKSGEDVQYYDMGLTNSQFNIQSTKMAEEMIPLHDIIDRYANTVAEMYVRLDGDEKNIAGYTPANEQVVQEEIRKLRELAARCRAQGDDCDQDLTDEILRRVIFLSKQDNQKLRKAVDLTDSIIAELNTREKQSILKHTPGIWPARGYLISPYGDQTDPLNGRRMFRQGITIGALPGTEVRATAPGLVTRIEYDQEYGLYVWISHRYGMKTFYAHLDQVDVKLRSKVAKEQVIGRVGRSGRAPVPMLYYEVHVGTVAYNPHAFLNNLQDEWLIQP